jgi:hypothetical protein
MDIKDSSLLNAHPTTTHHTQSLGHSIFLKRSRHYYGHQYSRRNSGNHANASTSRGKAASLRDERLSFKLATQFNSQTATGHHSGAYLFLVINSAPIYQGSISFDGKSVQGMNFVLLINLLECELND